MIKIQTDSSSKICESTAFLKIYRNRKTKTGAMGWSSQQQRQWHAGTFFALNTWFILCVPVDCKYFIMIPFRCKIKFEIIYFFKFQIINFVELLECVMTWFVKMRRSSSESIYKQISKLGINFVFWHPEIKYWMQIESVARIETGKFNDSIIWLVDWWSILLLWI